jgi:hypothetical protein
MSIRCQWGRSDSFKANSPEACMERPVPDGCFCARHREIALARVRRDDRPRRWPTSFAGEFGKRQVWT